MIGPGWSVDRDLETPVGHPQRPRHGRDLLTDEGAADIYEPNDRKEIAYDGGFLVLSKTLRLTIDALRDADLPLETLALEPLDDTGLTQLVADAVRVPTILGRDLAALVLEKTGGNPFFVQRFLQSLANGGHLHFVEPMGAWQWDTEAIRSLDITDNVVEFLVRQLLELPEEARALLQVAACLGNRFSLDALDRVADRSEAERVALLATAIEAGQILPIGSGWRRLAAGGIEPGDAHSEDLDFRFAHDRVQQAAYSLLSEPRRAELHHRIGLAAAARLDAQADASLVFEAHQDIYIYLE